MSEDTILEEYDVLCINSNNDELQKNVKNDIITKEQEAQNNKKSGLILLAGNMLSLGITINSCDVVMLLNNNVAADRVF